MSRREYLDSVVDDGAQNLGQKPIYEKENSEWYLKQQKREGDKKKLFHYLSEEYITYNKGNGMCEEPRSHFL